MSKRHKGRRRGTAGTYQARLAKLLERAAAWQARNALVPKRRRR